MASTTQDELYRMFLAVSGRQTPAIEDANAMLADLVAQLREPPSSVPKGTPASTTPIMTTSMDGGSTDRVLPAVAGQQTPAAGDANAILADVIAQLRKAPGIVPTATPTSTTPITITSMDGGSTDRAFPPVPGQETPAIGNSNAMLADVAAQLRDSPNGVPLAALAGTTPTTTTSMDGGITDRAFPAVSGQQTAALGDATAMLADAIAQIGELRSSIPTPTAASKTQSTTQTTSNDSGISLGSVASTVLTSGFGLAPLISGLVSLFSGGDAAAPPPLVKYAMPATADFQAAESQGQVTGMDYNQMGMPRSDAAAAARGGASGTANGTANSAAPQITVNVQAMDARSFMDRSNDIALAVRDAMLNLNAINDVVNEL